MKKKLARIMVAALALTALAGGTAQAAWYWTGWQSQSQSWRQFTWDGETTIYKVGHAPNNTVTRRTHAINVTPNTTHLASTLCIADMTSQVLQSPVVYATSSEWAITPSCPAGTWQVWGASSINN